MSEEMMRHVIGSKAFGNYVDDLANVLTKIYERQDNPPDHRVIKGAFPREEEILESAGLIEYNGISARLTPLGMRIYEKLKTD